MLHVGHREGAERALEGRRGGVAGELLEAVPLGVEREVLHGIDAERQLAVVAELELRLDDRADVLGDLTCRPALANLAGEVVRVADAEGVRSEGFDGYDPDAMRFAASRDWAAIHRSLDRLAEFNRHSLKQKSGVWRDLAVRRRRTEVDHQIGPVVARAHGLEAPLNQRLVELIHALEEGRRPMARANLDELRRLSEEMYH